MIMFINAPIGPAQKIQYASLALRVGLAFVFLYAAISAFRTPAAWLGYIPSIIADRIDPQSVLYVMAAMQTLLAIWLLWGKWLCYSGAAAVLLLGGIVVSNMASLTITFRDVGLLFAAAAVTVLGWAETPAGKK